MEFSTLLLTVITTSACLYYFLLKNLSYFKRLKIPHVRPIPLLGNTAPFMFQHISMAQNLLNIYNKFSEAKYFGFFEFINPKYVIRDPELINSIAIKNFDHFCDHMNFINDKLEPIASRNLFDLKGDDWRKVRKLLSPSFTSSKMKIMFELMCQCAENLTDFLITESGSSGKVHDIKDVAGRYTNDMIASCAFGIRVDSFKHPNNEFHQLARSAITFSNPKLMFIFLMNRNFPKISNLLKLRMFSEKVDNFFTDLVTNTVKIRDEQGIVRPDMIQLMMETRSKDHGPAFDINEMIAQAFVFFLAGFDTVRRAICFAAHELAINPVIQNKLREEIKDVLKKTNNKPTYEAINDMKYMNAVVNETLRLYPAVLYIDRLCVKNFELPPATPDGKPITLKPGDSIWFPIYALHHDPKYYADPEKFDPDRFLNGEVDYSVYMPFGVGPRSCIGYKFALIEIKLMLFYLLWHCDLEPDVKTVHPIVLNKKAYAIIPENGFWLKVRAKKSSVTNKKYLSNEQKV